MCIDIIEKHMGIVTYHADRFQGFRNLEREDLVQAGIEGLLEAIKRFKEEKGFKFATYAPWWVRQKMNAFICEQNSLPPNYQTRQKVIKEQYVNFLYLEDVLSNHEEIIRHQGMSTEMLVSKKEKNDHLKECISHLNEKEQIVIKKYSMIDGVVMEDVAKEMGVTRQRVQQIEQKALWKIKNCLKRKDIYG